jgi:hypothetical protein
MSSIMLFRNSKFRFFVSVRFAFYRGVHMSSIRSFSPGFRSLTGDFAQRPSGILLWFHWPASMDWGFAHTIAGLCVEGRSRFSFRRFRLALTCVWSDILSSLFRLFLSAPTASVAFGLSRLRPFSASVFLLASSFLPGFSFGLSVSLGAHSSHLLQIRSSKQISFASFTHLSQAKHHLGHLSVRSCWPSAGRGASPRFHCSRFELFNFCPWCMWIVCRNSSWSTLELPDRKARGFPVLIVLNWLFPEHTHKVFSKMSIRTWAEF